MAYLNPVSSVITLNADGQTIEFTNVRPEDTAHRHWLDGNDYCLNQYK